MADTFSNLAPPRFVVVAPTYDNARTLRAVLDGVAIHSLPIVVVNDGSRDDTADVLRDWLAGDATGRFVVDHGVNRGKAAALRSGFERAATLGFTHAVTIDTDGQHDPADVPALLAIARATPGAIVLGTRTTQNADYPCRSRVGRASSNALVWLIGGVRVADSQCGLRVYPLEVVRELGARTSRYAFETEVLARAGWANVPVREAPIRCIYALPTGRVTHFRPWRDSLSAAWMHTRLIARTLFLVPPRKLNPTDDDTVGGTLVERSIRWVNPFRTWRLIRRDVRERERFAAAAGVGMFVGCQPWFGLKTVICVAIAKAFRLPPLVVMGASSLTTPPVGPFAWLASIVLGNLLLHGALPNASQYDVRTLGAGAVFRALALEWIVGAIVVGAIAGGLMWAAAQALVRRLGEPGSHGFDGAERPVWP